MNRCDQKGASSLDFVYSSLRDRWLTECNTFRNVTVHSNNKCLFTMFMSTLIHVRLSFIFHLFWFNHDGKTCGLGWTGSNGLCSTGPAPSSLSLSTARWRSSVWNTSQSNFTSILWVSKMHHVCFEPTTYKTQEGWQRFNVLCLHACELNAENRTNSEFGLTGTCHCKAGPRLGSFSFH